MCGRFTLIRLSDFLNLFPWILPPDQEPSPRYNIAPTQAIAVAANRDQPKIEYFRWGLIPSWAKDPSIGVRMINARAETLAEKPAFRTALVRRRCLIPAHGFYEWRKSADGRTRTPMYVQMSDQRPFAFAGLWDVWRDTAGSEVPSCTIITVEPNSLMRTIHGRMPAILGPDEGRVWLAPREADLRQVLGLLAPYPADRMKATVVSPLVNSPRNDLPQCIEAVQDGSSGDLFG